MPGRLEDIHTFVALDRRASAGTVGTLGHSPEPGTSGPPRLGSRQRELDHWQARIQWEVVEAGLVQGDNSVLQGVGWDRPMVRCPRWQRVLSPLRPCADCLPPFYVASIPFGFP